jgi:hypothetical protein
VPVWAVTAAQTTVIVYGCVLKARRGPRRVGETERQEVVRTV